MQGLTVRSQYPEKGRPGYVWVHLDGITYTKDLWTKTDVDQAVASWVKAGAMKL